VNQHLASDKSKSGVLHSLFLFLAFPSRGERWRIVRLWAFVFSMLVIWSRLGVFLHEAAGHALAWWLWGGSVDSIEVYLFAGGIVRRGHFPACECPEFIFCMAGLFVQIILGAALAIIVAFSIRGKAEVTYRRATILHVLAWGAGLNLIGALHYSLLGAFYGYGDSAGYSWLFLPSLLLIFIFAPVTIYLWVKTLGPFLVSGIPKTEDNGNVFSTRRRLGLTGVLIFAVPALIYLSGLALETKYTGKSFASLRAEGVATERAIEEKKKEKLNTWRETHGDKPPPPEVIEVKEEEIDKPFPLMYVIFGLDLLLALFFLFLPLRFYTLRSGSSFSGSEGKRHKIRIPWVTPLAAALLALFLCYLFYPLARIYFDKALADWRKGNSDNAIVYFNKAIEHEPEWASAFYNRGLVKRDINDIDGAIADMTRAIEFNPEFADAYLNRGRLKRRKEDFEGAIQDFNEAIKLAPDKFNAYYARGLARWKRGNIDGALSDFAKAVELEPEYWRIFYSRGFCLFWNGMLEKALEDFTRVLDILGRGEEFYDHTFVYCCIIKARLDEISAMRSKAKEYLPLIKGNERLKQILSFLSGDIDENELLETFRSVDDPDTRKKWECSMYYFVAEMRLAAGDRSGAKEFFNKCIGTGEAETTEYKCAVYELKRLESPQGD